PNADARLLPAEDEWLIEGVGETATGAELTCGVRGQRIVRYQQRGGRGDFRAAENLFAADPHERVQIDHDRVGPCRQELSPGPFRFVARIEDEEVRIRETRLRCHARVGRVHAGRIDAPDLRVGVSDAEENADNHDDRSTETLQRPAVAGTARCDDSARFAKNREASSSTANETIMTTAIITTTFGSSKFWPATTSAAAVLRCAVPSASTLRVSVAGPPSTQPMPTDTAVKTTAARMPNVPSTLSTLLK